MFQAGSSNYVIYIVRQWPVIGKGSGGHQLFLGSVRLGIQPTVAGDTSVELVAGAWLNISSNFVVF